MTGTGAMMMAAKDINPRNHHRTRRSVTEFSIGRSSTIVSDASEHDDRRRCTGLLY